MQDDIESCLFMTSLGEFETYMKTTYIVGLNMVEDLLSRLFEMGKPANYTESIRGITEALNALKTIRVKKLDGKFTEVHLEKIIEATLMKGDAREFRKEWAKEKSLTMLSSSMLEPDDESLVVDFDRTIVEENDTGSLTARKEFLVRILQRKLIELNDLQVSKRTLGEKVKEERKSGRIVRFKDKTFRLTELSEEEAESFEDEISEDEDKIFSVMTSTQSNIKTQNTNKRESKYRKRSCPIQCGKEHSNGSLYFCAIFRKKPKDERKEIQKKTHVCITCLSKVSKEHKCPVGP